jgi:hypothetical protein
MERRNPVGVDVVTRIVIEQPAGVVSAFAANPDNAPVWYENIKSIEWESAPPLRVGSRVAFVARFLGRRLAYTYEVSTYDPAAHLVMRTAEGPFPMETSYEWRELGPARTEMTLRNRGTPSGFSRLMQPFLSVAMRRANRADLARLKTRLERRP